MENLAKDIVKRLEKGGTIYAIGNGGSCAEASHLVGELIGKFKKKRYPIKAVALTDPAVITCIANDFGYDSIYSRQLEALLEENDVLISFTTSGKSQNILNAMDVAINKNALNVCFCGVVNFPKICILVLTAEKDSRRVQEEHLKLIHDLVEEIEELLF